MSGTAGANGNAGGGGAGHGANAGSSGTAGSGNMAGAAGTQGAAGTGQPVDSGAASDAGTTTGAAGNDGGDAGIGDGGISPLGSPLPLCNGLIPCAAGTSCVNSVSHPTDPNITEGHCFPIGDGAGACVADGSCNPGYACRGVCLPEAAIGADCSVNAACGPNVSCDVAAAGAAPTCTADGQKGVQCRTTSPPCDTGLACSLDEVCETAVAVGASCTADTGCPGGSRCLQTPGAAGMTCNATGAVGGLCRTTTPQCDAGLVCNGAESPYLSQCVIASAEGATCSSTSPCGVDLWCVDNGSGPVCQPGGSLQLPCRTDGSCDAGLTCATGTVCQTSASVVADGATCVPGSTYCKLYSSCQNGVCIHDGAKGGACAAPAGTCAAGLVCTVNLCAAPIAVGGACTIADVCVAGAACTSSVCRTMGAAGGQCRPITSGSQCDAGLICAGACHPATLPLGAACPGASGELCVGEADCLGGKCVARGKLGGYCRLHDPNGPCDPLLACSSQSLCALALAQGATCGAFQPCGLPNICVKGTDGKLTCATAGYTETALPAAAFVDACATGVHAPRNGGATSSAVNIPYPFRFWGSSYTTVWPSFSGALFFGSGGLRGPLPDGVGNGYLPTALYGPVAAPFWDSLYLRAAPASDICYLVMGTTPNRQFVVEWAHAGRVGRASVDLSFEVVLHESTVIDFVYGTMSATAGPDAAFADGSRAAIGLQSGGSGATTDLNGIGVVHVGTVAAGTALRYTPQ
jgi:hypothetical protein